METQFYFASPDGDISVRDNDLKRPFLEDAQTAHADFTLGLYFQLLHDFVFKKNHEEFVAQLKNDLHNDISLNDIERCLIKSEKHGAFYHIASIELWVGEQSVKYALSTALTPQGRTCLERDCQLLDGLRAGPGPHSVPQVFFNSSFVASSDSSEIELCTALLEWFEGYHEWHISDPGPGQKRALVVWDMSQGNYFLSEHLSLKLIQEISRILTQYYNPKTAQQIFPWHHAAGDFIVKPSADNVNVKLITVRDYRPYSSTEEKSEAAWIANMVRFFLHTSIRMHLDKLDGVGETVWLDTFYVRPFVEGFFEGYRKKFESKEVELAPEQFVHILQMFGAEEMYAMCGPLMETYQQESESDFTVISTHVERHFEELHRVLLEIVG